MTNEEVKDLVSIRQYVISEFKKLDGGQNPSTSMMRQIEAATVYTKIIENLDYMLRDYVNFE